MYTVFRFDLSNARPSLEKLAAQLVLYPDSGYDGPDKRIPNRVSITASDDDNWEEHLKSLESFLSRFSDVIGWALENQISMFFDIAIYRDDIPGWYGGFRCPAPFLRELSSRQIALEFTFYK